MTTSNRIHALPLHLANQIAAGEVIERPASVVKELIENSLDAGATLIDIEIESAGNQLIHIRDNGSGIHPDDLPLALSRHATSKLHSSQQLSHISSLGFRGEALPSITSISQLTITSRQADSDYAWSLNGETNEIAPASHPHGTSIEVRDLFFNLPARRHFLRSNKTEQHHILTTLQRLALSQFEVGFNCKLSDTQQLKLPAAITSAQIQQRLAKICGKNFIENSVYLQQQYTDIGLKGWLVKADAHRAQTDVQHFFINGRVIRDRVINHAIKQAYGDSIPAGRQAAYVLYLTIPLESVDINVHPTKHEVRFRNARLIHGLITSALQEALEQAPSTDIKPENTVNDASYIPDQIAETSKPYQSSLTKIDQKHSSFGHIITLLEQRYALSQSAQHGLLLIDLQLADQSLRRQQLHHSLATNTLKKRPILVPIKIDCNASEIKLAEHYSAELAHIGVELQLTEHTVIVKTIPALLAQSKPKELVTSLLNALQSKGSPAEQFEEVLQQHLPLIAIQQLEDAQYLIEQLEDSPTEVNWCKQLDQQTLNSLFSS